MRQLCYLILTFTLLIFITSISFAEEPPLKGISEVLYRYMPLETGQWRQYDRSYWSMTHGYAWVEEIIQTVVGRDTLFGKYPAFILIDEGISYDSIWVAYAEDELRRYEDEPKDYSDYKVILKLPLEEGQVWPFSPFPVDGDTAWAHIVSADDTVEVPAGEFEHCIHIFALPFYHYWFAPDQGIVRFSSAEPDSLTGTDDDLMNCDLGR